MGAAYLHTPPVLLPFPRSVVKISFTFLKFQKSFKEGGKGKNESIGSIGSIDSIGSAEWREP